MKLFKFKEWIIVASLVYVQVVFINVIDGGKLSLYQIIKLTLLESCTFFLIKIFDFVDALIQIPEAWKEFQKEKND